MYSTNPAGIYFAEDSIPTPSAEMILELLADVQQLLKRAADTENSEDHEQLQARVSFHRHCAEEHNNYGLNSSTEDCTECNESAIQHLHTAPLAGMQRRAVPNADDSEFLYANELMNEMQPFRHFHKRCPCIHASAPKKETEAAAAESHLPTRHHQHTQVHAESTPLAVALNGARTRPMKLNIERSALMQRRKAHTS